MRWIYTGLWGMFLIMISATALSSQTVLEQIKGGAESAQQQCFMKIHFDTIQYQDCIDELAERQMNSSPQKLGTYYFAYVGAMDAVRTGMYGSYNTAWYFLQRFRKIQRTLGIDDRSLCTTVPGNCDIRLSQIDQMRKMPQPAPIDTDGGTPKEKQTH